MCYLFDAMVTDSIAQDAVHGALKELAENQNILKITHDCGRLAALLQFHLSAGLRTVFDTQVLLAIPLSILLLHCMLA